MNPERLGHGFLLELGTLAVGLFVLQFEAQRGLPGVFWGRDGG